MRRASALCDITAEEFSEPRAFENALCKSCGSIRSEGWIIETQDSRQETQKSVSAQWKLSFVVTSEG